MSTATLHNFAYDNLPQKWGDFYGHDSAKILARRFLLNQPIQSIFIQGESGVGKTSFVLLLIKAYRCLNRPKDSIDPCGQCAACKEHDIRLADKFLSDVYWLQPGASAENTISADVKEALLAAEKGHRHTGSGNKDLIWVVADEFHLFPRNLRQQMLSKAELRNNLTNVCYIFITMQADTLAPTERIAFKRRGSYLNLQPFTEREIYSYLRQKFPDCPHESAAIIAKCSENSPGLAISHYDHVYNVDKDLDPEVVAMLLNVANNEQRLQIWTNIRHCQPIESLRRDLESLSKYAQAKQLAAQFIEDILRTVDLNKDKSGPTIDQLFAIRILNQFLSNHKSSRLLDYLIELYGLVLVSEEAVLLPQDYDLNYGIR